MSRDHGAGMRGSSGALMTVHNTRFENCVLDDTATGETSKIWGSTIALVGNATVWSEVRSLVSSRLFAIAALSIVGKALAYKMTGSVAKLLWIAEQKTGPSGCFSQYCY